MNNIILVLITCANMNEAQRISRALVREKLCACVNIVSGIKSVFWWQGKIDSSPEVLLLAKSLKNKFAKIVKLVKSLHSYEVPEIIALPIIAGEKKYLSWIRKSVK
ncbi:MAG: divalent-cation tolerance protein CutA [Candidatus Omnitrophica bacterium]|nr:divalent-cation tolerance protein CutA [Candidatus Omnitrophota bacterium]